MTWCTMIFDLMLVSISLGVRITTWITTIFTNFVLSATTRQPDLLSRNNLGILLLQLSLDTGFNSWDASTDLGLILDPWGPWFKSHRLDRLGSRTFRPSKNCMPRSTVRSNATYPRGMISIILRFLKSERVLLSSLIEVNGMLQIYSNLTDFSHLFILKNGLHTLPSSLGQIWESWTQRLHHFGHLIS